MRLLLAAISTELLKSLRARLPWAVAAGFSIVPLVSGLFMVILKDPAMARRLGLIGTKAQLTAGTADWPTLVGLLGQAMAIGGAILFAFLVAWLFGREFADRTVRGLMAIATPRWAIVTAKLTVAAIWSIATAGWVLALGLAVGAWVGLPGWTDAATGRAIGAFAAAALMILALQSTTALVASAGRGYLPPLAWAVLTVAVGQILAVLGWAAWFPWAVPALVTGAAGPEGETASLASVILLVAVAIIGAVATFAWWARADQTT